MANPHPGVAEALGNPTNDTVLNRAIVDTIREPLIVLDSNLNVVIASKSFYKTFEVSEEETVGRKIYSLGNGQWDIEILRLLLEKIIPQQSSFQDYRVEHTFPHLGRRVMLLNGQEVEFKNGETKKLLLSIFDITDRNKLEDENKKLLEHKDMLLQEMRHRIANSLQLIASILLMKAESVQSEESRLHLSDAHQRIMSIATVQRQLEPAGIGNEIDVHTYLTALCNSLAASMVGDRKPISISITAVPHSIDSGDAILLGLITTELVINSLKHAFPEETVGAIQVIYETDKEAWRLGVVDNGSGMTEMGSAEGLGTSLVDAMARQLKSVVEKETGDKGTTIWVVRRHEVASV